MSLDERFNVAAAKVKSFSRRPPDHNLLKVYGLYKQATIGDNNTSKPSDLKGQFKWDSWKAKKGMTTDVAKETYIAYAEKLSASYK